MSRRAENEAPCGCFTCTTDRKEGMVEIAGFTFLSRMIVCSACGNKRCPRATHHDQPCSGSNQPGQPGSRYPAPIPPAEPHP